MLTGQLGDVMRESAQAAYSYAKARAKELDIAEEDFSNYDLHIHIPEGRFRRMVHRRGSRSQRRWSRRCRHDRSAKTLR